MAQKGNIFQRLTQLFRSGPTVKRKVRSTARTDLKSSAVETFRRAHNDVYSNTMSAYGSFDRMSRYSDFSEMEATPEIASALDIYADEMTTFSALSPMLNIKCRNDEIKAVLNILYHKIMNIEHNLFGWCRTMCKYGDFILYLDIDDNEGIQSTIAIPLQEVERLEGLDATNPNYVQYQWNSAGMTFENWQVAHFRILGNDKYAPYGTSVLEPVRRIWRQLTLMEDAMMAYRIVRSSERKVFKIDVGAVPPQEVEQFMQKIVSQLKRHSIVNKDTGRVDLRYNPMSIEEDYYIPVRAGSVTDIQNLGGGQNTTAIDDVKYLRDKMFSGIKIPQAYLTMGEGAQEDKTTLATKDIRFARTIQRLQRSMIHELEKVGIIHLYTLGYRGEDLLNFKLALNNPSKIAELQELEHWKTKFDIAASATEGYFSRRWVADNIFGMSHEEFLRNQREQYYDRKHDTALEGVAEAASAGGGEAGGGGLDLGGGGDEGGLDLGGDEGGGDLDLGGDEGGGDEGGGDESALLAAPPGSRNSPRLAKSLGKRARAGKKYVTKGSKGKAYQKVATDKRPQGARTRNYASVPTPEMNTYRTNNLGGSELRSLARGIYEEQDPNYLRDQEEEKALLEVNHSVKMLIESLETKTTENNNEE